MPLLRRSVLRAQGHAAVSRSHLTEAEGHGRPPGAHRRGLRRPPDRAARGRGPPRHRDPLHPARPATTPGRPTTSWSRFPPLTTEVQFDEKWSFVAKKEANCDRSDPADDHKGDYWDHVAYDPEHRLVVAVVPGARDVEGTEALVGDSRRRTGGRTMRLMTSDAYPAYETAILGAYGETVTPPAHGQAGPPQGRVQGPPRKGLVYATVEKVKEAEGPGGRDPDACGLRDDGGGGGGPEGLAGEPVDQHVVARAAAPDRSASQREEVAEDVPVLEGLAVSRGGDLFHAVQLQLLLAGEDSAPGRSRMGRYRKRTPGDGPPAWPITSGRWLGMDQPTRACYGVRTRPKKLLQVVVRPRQLGRVIARE